LKNKLSQSVVDCWRVLTEVPGWPDAPGLLRLRRLIPAIIPLTALLLLFVWEQTWRQPRIRAARTDFMPLLALQQEITDLQLAVSNDKAAETATLADQASHTLLDGPRHFSSILEQFARTAQTQGWEATFATPPAAPSPPDPDALMYFINARGKLVATPANQQPFASLLSLLEQFSPPERSIDLTRLSVRADEQGRQTAEILLRAGCRVVP
jgi:hypothetical protein